MLETIALRREREMLRENFAAIVSHELKSPLGAVQQNLYVLAHELEPVVGDDQRHLLERMKTRLGDLLHMVDTWLRSVSVDIAGIRDRFTSVAVPDVIRTAVENIEQHAVRKSVDVVTSIDESHVLGDEGTLVEALTNIIGNAVKYTLPGGTVTVASKPDDGAVRIAIRDTGVGIPDEAKKRIFDDFYRSETGLAESGVGLGLAIARRIVEAHDGSIIVDSRPGEGSTFTIVLPAAPSHDAQHKHVIGHDDAPSKEHSND
jgi:signal transduction histidine kinase